LAALERGSSVLVAAPTGVGKTVIAEMAIDRALAKGQSAFYTSPLKALSNQKASDFRARYGPERVGLVTGDVQDNAAAPVLVLTTEIVHNMLLSGDSGRMRNVSCLVFDEFHFLSDPERGRVWEETILLCPKHVQIVCLSATLPNIQELADWMGQHVGTVEVIVEMNRPVPLSYHYFAESELHSIVSDQGAVDTKLQRLDAGSRRGAPAGIVDLLPVLLREDMTPALYFAFSRREVERQAGIAARWLAEHPLPADVGSRIAAAVGRLDEGLVAFPQSQALIACLRGGVGFHHAGLLPELKGLVEQLFGDGLLRLLCTTETFALGLNMPARTVIVARISKFDGRGHRDLTAREFQQMAGRAGRRGKDERGYVIVMADPWKPFSSVAWLLQAPLEPVQSAFAFSYNTFLNITAAYGDAAAEAMVSRSFLVHQLGAEQARAETRLGDLRQHGSRKQVDEARRRAESLRASLGSGRHQHELAVRRGALAELGYLTSPAKAALLRGIFDDGALLLAELLTDRRSELASMGAPAFAEVIGWFAGAGQRRPSRVLSVRLPASMRHVRQLLEDVVARVQRAERQGGMLLTTSIVPAFPNLICRWCEGDTADVLCQDYQLAEGDVALFVERTRQLLRQLARAASAVPDYLAMDALAAEAQQVLAIRTALLDEDLLSS
jgi:superfamily II RNA helicase